MKRKLLFSLALFKVCGKKDVVYTTDFRQALQALRKLRELRIQKAGVVNFYNNGCERVIYTKESPLRMDFCFGVMMNYQNALRKAKSDKTIIIPPEFLYDKKKYPGECFVYSARCKKIEIIDLNTVTAAEQVLDVFLQGSAVYNEFYLDMLESDKKMPEILPSLNGREFVLGNGMLTFYCEGNCDLTSALTNFKNNLTDYSFIRGRDVRYILNGSVEYSPENDFFIFREDVYLSAEQALKCSPHQKLIEQQIKKGHKDFVIDKKYDIIFPAPKNSFFVPVDTFYYKWNLL